MCIRDRPSAEPTPEPKVKQPLTEGMEDATLVPEVQSRLMTLGYMGEDQPTNLYGPMTCLLYTSRCV